MAKTKLTTNCGDQNGDGEQRDDQNHNNIQCQLAIATGDAAPRWISANWENEAGPNGILQLGGNNPCLLLTRGANWHPFVRTRIGQE
jgi:hypothetical protein